MTKRTRIWILAAIGFAALAFSAPPALASGGPTIGSDGAIDGNLNWEQGKASTWYIELQRYGLTLIQDGIEKEHDTDIRQGILILDWGFAHQGSDGSFPGTGDAFHSTSIFVEAAAQATALLKSYKPVTYSYNASYYSGKVSSYTSKLKAAAYWLIRPDVASTGQSYDQPYTHRRYLLAAALGEVAQLTGDSTLAANAASYVQAGLPLQWTGGTMAVQYPDGTHYVDLTGVNPEMGGFDANYQAAGLRYAALYWLHGGAANLKSSLVNMLTKGLIWEAPRIDAKGNIDITGSTRVGIERNRDGTVKQINQGEVIDAFAYGYQLTGSELFRVCNRRVGQRNARISSSAISSKGAVDTNANYDAGTSSTYSVDLQKLGADYIAAGVDREDASLIATGLTILDWGFAHEASDGSFPGTSSAFYTVAQFIEGAARATMQLKNYQPVTYTSNPNTYASKVSSYTSKIQAAAKWLMRSDIASSGQKSMAPMTHRYYVLAAALGEAGVLCADTSMQSAAVWYVNAGLPLQWPDGVNPENGTSSVNYQAKGLQYAEFYLPYVTNSTLKSKLVTMLSNGLAWESAFVDSNGIVNTSSPSKSIGPAFALGYEATGDARFQVIAARMGALD